ncbi:hypothetical protein CR513_16281, partial [Mucuna pruriens]
MDRWSSIRASRNYASVPRQKDSKVKHLMAPPINTSVTNLVIVAENGRLKNIDTIAKRFAELAMAYKGEVKATVTTVVIEPSILGSLLLVFSQKVFHMFIMTKAQQIERSSKSFCWMDTAQSGWLRLSLGLSLKVYRGVWAPRGRVLAKTLKVK